MGWTRDLEAFCETCAEPTEHLATEKDPGTCQCTRCGTVQQLMIPIA